MSRKFVTRLRIESEYIILLAPALVVFVIGMLVPLVMGFSYSLTNWTGYSTNFRFIGFSNYLKLFQETRYYSALKFTILFAILNTLFQNILALSFAIILDRYVHYGKVLYRTALFVPVLLSPILVGWLWSKVFGVALPQLNMILGTKINFRLLDSPRTVLWGILIVNNWMWIGYWMMIYLAALQSVPQELYEQCEIDGGGELSKIRHVTLPLIVPAITVCVIGITSGRLKIYDLIVTTTDGGPGTASESIIMYLYRTAIDSARAGFASAASLTYLMLLLIVSVIQLYILRRREVQL